jgi:hypothetical protein
LKARLPAADLAVGLAADLAADLALPALPAVVATWRPSSSWSLVPDRLSSSEALP